MFREMHHMEPGSRAMDLAERMAERRSHSLAATSRFFSRARLRRMLSALAMATNSPHAEGRA
jgi:hypothetical protein